MAPSAVGPYRFLERLGAGANGDVCLAEDTRLRRRVALKKLQGTAGADTAQLRRRLLREARAAARLNHPHLAAVYDVLETDEGVHIVMEYVRGGTLAPGCDRARFRFSTSSSSASRSRRRSPTPIRSA